MSICVRKCVCVSVCVDLTFLQANPCPCVLCRHLLTSTNSIKHCHWHWTHSWIVHFNAKSSKVNPKHPPPPSFSLWPPPLTVLPYSVFLSLPLFHHFHLYSLSLSIIACCVLYLSGILKRPHRSVTSPQHKHTPTHKDTNTLTDQLWTPSFALDELAHRGVQYVCVRDRKWRLEVLEEGVGRGNRLSIHALGRENVKDRHGRWIERHLVLSSWCSALNINQE